MSQWILPGLAWAFSFWMVAVAVHRRSSGLWIAVILLFSPLGGLAYLVYRFIQARRPRPPGNALEKSERASEVNPRLPHEAALEVADQLEEQRRFGEAVLIYRRTLEQRKGHLRAMHGLARCLFELEQRDEALSHYEALMAEDPRYRNYAAALEFAEALQRGGRGSEAIDLLEGLVRETGRLNHRMALAHYCVLGGQTSRARRVLSEALAAYESSPPPEQEANRRWQRRIADKLQELAPS
jgi:hypothetical protein